MEINCVVKERSIEVIEVEIDSDVEQITPKLASTISHKLPVNLSELDIDIVYISKAGTTYSTSPGE